MSSEAEFGAPGAAGADGGRGSGASTGHGFRSYLVGLGLATLMSIASFWAAQSQLIYGPAVPVAIVVLAIAQMGIHLVFFLHITTAPDNTNNVLALAFGILIACLVIFGSLWIMANLDRNMLPCTGVYTRDRHCDRPSH
jgi:cytochrome o ubiquinol oxidase operon protein cyoD